MAGQSCVARGLFALWPAPICDLGTFGAMGVLNDAPLLDNTWQPENTRRRHGARNEWFAFQ